MFAKVAIRAADRGASERFYATVLQALAREPSGGDGERVEWGEFSLAAADAEHPATQGLHIAFAAASREAVDRFWHAGTAAGYRDDGPPGPRPQYRADYYGSFLLDPDGNSVEAVVHGATPGRGVDHLWLRVADVAATRRFYEEIAPHAGFEVLDRGPDRVFCSAPGGSFSLVAGERLTRNVHVAFPASHAAILRDPDGTTVELVGTAKP